MTKRRRTQRKHNCARCGNVNHRQRIISAVVLTLVISLSIGFFTEYIRQSMTFSWAIEENDVFVYEISVIGNTTTGTTTVPPQFAPMNNTRIAVEIVSLPNVSITFYAIDFIENIVEFLKTSTTFENGTGLHVQYSYAINSHVSNCILPIGGWSHLDSFFPNDIERPLLNDESYISVQFRDYFFFGYSYNNTNQHIEWFSHLNKLDGVPQLISFYNYMDSQPWIYWYNVTMTLIT